jgi:hypothetical protein
VIHQKDYGGCILVDIHLYADVNMSVYLQIRALILLADGESSSWEVAEVWYCCGPLRA